MGPGPYDPDPYDPGHHDPGPYDRRPTGPKNSTTTHGCGILFSAFNFCLAFFVFGVFSFLAFFVFWRFRWLFRGRRRRRRRTAACDSHSLFLTHSSHFLTKMGGWGGRRPRPQTSLPWRFFIQPAPPPSGSLSPLPLLFPLFFLFPFLFLLLFLFLLPLPLPLPWASSFSFLGYFRFGSKDSK